jgi:hypothetical protein
MVEPAAKLMEIRPIDHRMEQAELLGTRKRDWKSPKINVANCLYLFIFV